ncbi:hypothetical protein DPMN_002263 [Dreissena polymorpha]|uniref:Uncharacterized protein n=1 Tax=Dreissena polymorpha TaxID=45954 RepID=A0A9D4MLY3_DREPO|nr:hypothetical protein DPMN_002263 [Dreissena polymorpha]
MEVSHIYRNSLNACSIRCIMYKSFPLQQLVWNKFAMSSIESLLSNIDDGTKVGLIKALCLKCCCCQHWRRCGVLG